MDFTNYAKIKDNYCICYFGYSNEYLIQLDTLRPFIEKQYPGLNIYLGCKDDVAHLLSGKTLKLSHIKSRKSEFAHIRELKYDHQSHPIEQFIKECNIKNYMIDNKSQKDMTTLCVIISHGSYPTTNLTNEQIQKCKMIARSQRFDVAVDVDIQDAGWVIGHGL